MTAAAGPGRAGRRNIAPWGGDPRVSPGRLATSAGEQLRAGSLVPVGHVWRPRWYCRRAIQPARCLDAHHRRTRLPCGAESQQPVGVGCGSWPAGCGHLGVGCPFNRSRFQSGLNRAWNPDASKTLTVPTSARETINTRRNLIAVGPAASRMVLQSPCRSVRPGAVWIEWIAETSERFPAARKEMIGHRHGESDTLMPTIADLDGKIGERRRADSAVARRVKR